MSDSWRQIMPVLVSIVIIIVIAVLRSYSKTLTAITATMPLNIALTLWIVSTAEKSDSGTMQNFTGSLLVGIISTVVFVVAIWLAARAGLRLGPVLVVGYLAWAATTGLSFLLGVQR